MLRVLALSLAATIASASIASANDKVVLLVCGASGAKNNVALCTKSAAVTMACPAVGKDCAQSLAAFMLTDGVHIVGASSAPEYIGSAATLNTIYTLQN
jgi:hypothetical protein